MLGKASRWDQLPDGGGYYPLKVPKSEFFPPIYSDVQYLLVFTCVYVSWFFETANFQVHETLFFFHGMFLPSVRWEVIPWLARNDAWRIGWTRSDLRSCWCKRLFLTEQFGNKVITCEKRNMWLLPVFFKKLIIRYSFMLEIYNWEYTSLSVHDLW